MRLKLAALALIVSAAATGTQAAAAPDGKALFTAKCSICHAATPTGGPPIGPTLYGVMGRKAGAKEGFKYSTALKASGATWTDAVVDKYLADPQAFAPGAFMPINVPAAPERQAIISYLKTLGPVAATAPGSKTTTTKKATSTSKTTKKS